MPTDQVPADLIEPKRLASILDVHLSTVHRWIKAGKLRAWRRAGERYLVSEAEGRALLVPVEVVPSEGPRTRAEEEGEAAQAKARLRGKGYRKGA